MQLKHELEEEKEKTERVIASAGKNSSQTKPKIGKSKRPPVNPLTGSKIKPPEQLVKTRPQTKKDSLK